MRSLTALWLAALAVLPLIGGETLGGENGVWILPRSCSLNSGSGFSTPLSAARASRETNDLSKGLQFLLPAQMGTTLVTMTVRGSNTITALPVENRIVRLSGTLLLGLAASGAERADIIAMDTSGHVLLMSLVFDLEESSATLYVF